MTTSKTKKELNGTTATTILLPIGDCSLGSILVAQSQRGICSILIGENPARLAEDLRTRFPKAHLIDEQGHAELVAQVAGLIEKPGAGLDLPLDVHGTAFQQLVWDAVGRIPPRSPQHLIPKLPGKSVRLERSVRWPRHAARIRWPSLSLAIK